MMKETYTTDDLNLLRLSTIQNNHFQLYRKLVEKSYGEIKAYVLAQTIKFLYHTEIQR